MPQSAYMKSVSGNFDPKKASDKKSVHPKKGKPISQSPLDNGYLKGFGRKKKS